MSLSRFFALALSAWSFSAAVAEATPAQVILIRHGEKPKEGAELNARGWQRADALAGIFQSDARFTQFGTPTAIFGMAPKQAGGSVRAIQTVTPLATALHLKVQQNITRDDIQTLADQILTNPAFDSKMVLVCWEHKVIPGIAAALGATMPPSKWGDNFDHAWLLTFTNGIVSDFQDVSENALPGDGADLTSDRGDEGDRDDGDDGDSRGKHHGHHDRDDDSALGRRKHHGRDNS